MTNADLGTAEVFISELRRSNLVERGELDHLLEDFLRRNPRCDAVALAEHLVERSVLTPFQAERVFSGKTQGMVLGAYVLTDSIGSGSMGSVYKAVSKNDRRTYAVKVLPRRSMWNVRLARRQVRAFSQFQHPTVVSFVDVGTSGGLHYLVWNFVEGETLEAMIQRRGKLDGSTTAQIGLQVAAGLVASHGQGLFHGFLKPSNIMIGEGGQVRILDFGIGSLLAENEGESLVDTMSTSNTLTSGLDCASPESIMEPTNRTPAGDQYSLGCVLYFCLTGRYPFSEGSAVEKMMAHQFKQPPSVQSLAPETPPDLAVVIDRLMQKKPEDRYHGADGAVEALMALAPKNMPAQVAQAMVQTPTPPLTARSNLARPRPSAAAMQLPQAPPAPEPSSLINSSPMLNPDLMPQSRQSTSRPSQHSKVSMPAPAPAPAPAPVLPTRQSFNTQPPPAPVPAPMHVSMSMPEIPSAAPPSSARMSVSASVRSSIYAGSNPLPPEPESNPMMGPIGFLALGATVAVACYLLVTSLLK
jgi:serine/threonine-protein kinase